MAPAICSLSGHIRSLSLSLQRAEAPTWASRAWGEDEEDNEDEDEEEEGRSEANAWWGAQPPCPGQQSAGVMRRVAPVAGQGWH